MAVPNLGPAIFLSIKIVFSAEAGGLEPHSYEIGTHSLSDKGQTFDFSLHRLRILIITQKNKALRKEGLFRSQFRNVALPDKLIYILSNLPNLSSSFESHRNTQLLVVFRKARGVAVFQNERARICFWS